MATFTQFEELECWKKARELTKRVYELTGRANFSRDYDLRRQIRDASVAVMSNIAEGHGRNGTREFIQFLSIAKGSVAEVRSQLYVALDQSYIERTEFCSLSDLATETGRIIGGLMKYLQGTALRGAKFRR